MERSFFPENEQNDQERSHRSEKNERSERVLKKFGTISKERNGTPLPESVRGANVPPPPPLYPPLLATSAMCATVELKTYFLSKLRNTDEEKKIMFTINYFIRIIIRK